MSCRNGIHYYADTGEAYEPGCDCMKEKVAALLAHIEAQDKRIAELEKGRE